MYCSTVGKAVSVKLRLRAAALSVSLRSQCAKKEWLCVFHRLAVMHKSTNVLDLSCSWRAAKQLQAHAHLLPHLLPSQRSQCPPGGKQRAQSPLIQLHSRVGLCGQHCSQGQCAPSEHPLQPSFAALALLSAAPPSMLPCMVSCMLPSIVPSMLRII